MVSLMEGGPLRHLTRLRSISRRNVRLINLIMTKLSSE